MTSSFQLESNGPRYEEIDGQWYAIADNGLKRGFEDFPVAFFPLLEASIGSLKMRHPISEKFPFILLFECAAYSESPYWQKLALDRIEEVNAVRDCSKMISGLVVNGLNQSIRHQAKRLSKKSKSSGFSGQGIEIE